MPLVCLHQSPSSGAPAGSSSSRSVYLCSRGQKRRSNPRDLITPANAKKQAGGRRGSGSNLHRNGLSKCTSSQQAACRRGWSSSWSRCHSSHKGTAAGRQTTGHRQSVLAAARAHATWTWESVGDDRRRALVSSSGTACTFVGASRVTSGQKEPHSSARITCNPQGEILLTISPPTRTAHPH